MKQFNAKKKIEDVDDFNEYASQLFENYLENFTLENGLIREVTEDDGGDTESLSFIYTNRGYRLADKMRSLLYKVGNAHFPNDDIEIETHLFMEV